MNPRLCFFDSEFAPCLGWFWKPGYEQSIHYGQVLKRKFMTSIQWRFEDEKRVSSFSLLDDMKRFRKDPTDDRAVVEKAAEVLSQCDIAVMHNGIRFDWREFKALLNIHDIKGVTKPIIIDTLKEARTSAFLSNKLGDLAKQLKTIEKLDNPTDFGKLVSGSISERIEEIEKSVKYGKGDIPAMAAIYYRLRPRMENHPHMGRVGIRSCKYCGSEDFKMDGTRRLASGNEKKMYRCKNPECLQPFYGPTVRKVIQ